MAFYLKNLTLLCPKSGLQSGMDLEIRSGRIAQIGTSDSHTIVPDTTVIDAKGALCLPGLINSHNHSPLMVVRGMVEDLGFAPAYIPGVPQGHWLSEEETLALARLGVMELLCSGATTIVDYYRKPQALARAAEEFGLRAIVGGRVMDADPEQLAQGRFVHNPKLGDETMRDALDLIDRWDGKADGRISAIHAPHAPDTCTRALLAEFAAMTERDGRQVHTHLAQSRMEVDQVNAREGMGPAEFMEDVGLLNDKLVAAHCIFLSEDEIARVGRNRVVVAHAPIGNASFGAAAPIMPLAIAGAQITLCTDTKSADMFEAMRMAIASARWRAGMEFVLDAKTVFGWATNGAAHALRGHAATGTIELGAPADLIVMDPLAPNLHPVVDGFGIVAHSGSGANVRMVVCDGEILVQDGLPTRVDPAEVIRTAQTVTEGLWKRARAA